MRHPSTNHSWYRAIGGGFAAITLVIGLSAFGQESSVPPPPPDSPQTSQPSQQEPPEASDVRAVRLSDVEGKVQVFNGTDPAFNQALQNMPAVEGMRFVTGDDGRIEIQFEDGSVARVTPNSSVTLSQLHRNPDGSTVTAIDANTGLTYYELNGRAGLYSVRFGPDIVTPVDSAIFRINLDGNPVDLAVTHGTVHLSDGQSLALDVRTNHSVHFDLQNPGQYEQVQSVAADTWDQWNSDRDQALATLEENATTARASTGNPDDAAWNDLDYYGDWYNVPGYGQGWSPSGVGDNWDPFGVGAWGYYSGIGYTWISGYSWGWWPYHCGAWNWFGNYGWMWFPGNCGGFGSVGVGWYPYARVWRCPPNYKPPFRPKAPPVHGLPPHGPLPRPEPLVAVNRGQFDQFRTLGGPKPSPRSFDFQGQSINPAEATIRVRTAGPLGEGFTSATVRTHPEVLDRSDLRLANPGRSIYQPGVSGFQPGNHGTTGYVPPVYHPAPAPVAPRGSYSGGGGVHYSPPPAPPAVHSSPPPASGGHPH
jgi:FecR protein